MDQCETGCHFLSSQRKRSMGSVKVRPVVQHGDLPGEVASRTFRLIGRVSGQEHEIGTSARGPARATESPSGSRPKDQGRGEPVGAPRLELKGLEVRIPHFPLGSLEMKDDRQAEARSGNRETVTTGFCARARLSQ